MMRLVCSIVIPRSASLRLALDDNLRPSAKSPHKANLPPLQPLPPLPPLPPKSFLVLPHSLALPPPSDLTPLRASDPTNTKSSCTPGLTFPRRMGTLIRVRKRRRRVLRPVGLGYQRGSYRRLWSAFGHGELCSFALGSGLGSRPPSPPST